MSRPVGLLPLKSQPDKFSPPLSSPLPFSPPLPSPLSPSPLADTRKRVGSTVDETAPLSSRVSLSKVGSTKGSTGTVDGDATRLASTSGPLSTALNGGSNATGNANSGMTLSLTALSTINASTGALPGQVQRRASLRDRKRASVSAPKRVPLETVVLIPHATRAGAAPREDAFDAERTDAATESVKMWWQTTANAVANGLFQNAGDFALIAGPSYVVSPATATDRFSSNLVIYALVRWQKWLHPIVWTRLNNVPFTVLEQGASIGTVVSIPDTLFRYVQRVASYYLPAVSRLVDNLCSDPHFLDTSLFSLRASNTNQLQRLPSGGFTTMSTEDPLSARMDAATADEAANEFRVTNVSVSGPVPVALTGVPDNGISPRHPTAPAAVLNMQTEDAVGSVVSALTVTPYIMTLEDGASSVYVFARSRSFPVTNADAAYSPTHGTQREGGRTSSNEFEETPLRTLGASPSTTNLFGPAVVPVKTAPLKYSAQPHRSSLDAAPVSKMSSQDHQLHKVTAAVNVRSSASQPDGNERAKPSKLVEVMPARCPAGYALYIERRFSGRPSTTASNTRSSLLMSTMYNALKTAALVPISSSAPVNVSAAHGRSNFCCASPTEPISDAWMVHLDHDNLSVTVSVGEKAAWYKLRNSHGISETPLVDFRRYMFDRLKNAGIVSDLVRAELQNAVPSASTAAFAVMLTTTDQDAIRTMATHPASGEWLKALAAIEEEVVPLLPLDKLEERIAHGMPVDDIVTAGRQRRGLQVLSRIARGSTFHQEARSGPSPSSYGIKQAGGGTVDSTSPADHRLNSSPAASEEFVDTTVPLSARDACSYYAVTVPADAELMLKAALEVELDRHFDGVIDDTHTLCSFRLIDALSCKDCSNAAMVQLLRTAARRIGRRSSINPADIRAALATSKSPLLPTSANGAKSSIQLVIEAIIDYSIGRMKDCLLPGTCPSEAPTGIALATSRDQVTCDGVLWGLVEPDLATLRLLHSVLNIAAAANNAASRYSEAAQSVLSRAAKSVHCLAWLLSSVAITSVPAMAAQAFAVESGGGTAMPSGERQSFQLRMIAMHTVATRIQAMGTKAAMPTARSLHQDAGNLSARAPTEDERRSELLMPIAVHGIVYSCTSLLFMVAHAQADLPGATVLEQVEKQVALSSLADLARHLGTQSKVTIPQLHRVHSWLRTKYTTSPPVDVPQSSSSESQPSAAHEPESERGIGRHRGSWQLSFSMAEVVKSESIVPISSSVINAPKQRDKCALPSADDRPEPSKAEHLPPRNPAAARTARLRSDVHVDDVWSCSYLLSSMVSMLGGCHVVGWKSTHIECDVDTVLQFIIRSARLAIASHWDAALLSAGSMAEDSSTRLQQQLADVMHDLSTCLWAIVEPLPISQKAAHIHAVVAAVCSACDSFVGERAATTYADLFNRLACISAACYVSSTAPHTPVGENGSSDDTISSRLALQLGDSGFVEKTVAIVASVTKVPRIHPLSDDLVNLFPMNISMLAPLTSSHMNTLNKPVWLVCKLLLEACAAVLLPSLDAFVHEQITPGAQDAKTRDAHSEQLRKILTPSRIAALRACARAAIAWHRVFMSDALVGKVNFELEPVRNQVIRALHLGHRQDVGIALLMHMTVTHVLSVLASIGASLTFFQAIPALHVPGLGPASCSPVPAIQLLPATTSPVGLPSFVQSMVTSRVTDFARLMAPGLLYTLDSSWRPHALPPSWQLALQLLAVESAIRVCGAGLEMRKVSDKKSADEYFLEHQHRRHEVQAMSEAVLAVGLPRMLCRMVSLEARARDTWLRQQSDGGDAVIFENATIPEDTGALSPTELCESVLKVATPLKLQFSMKKKGNSDTGAPQVAIDPNTGAPLVVVERVIGMDMGASSPSVRSQLFSWSSSESDGGEPEVVKLVENEQQVDAAVKPIATSASYSDDDSMGWDVVSSTATGPREKDIFSIVRVPRGEQALHEAVTEADPACPAEKPVVELRIPPVIASVQVEPDSTLPGAISDNSADGHAGFKIVSPKVGGLTLPPSVLRELPSKPSFARFFTSHEDATAVVMRNATPLASSTSPSREERPSLLSTPPTKVSQRFAWGDGSPAMRVTAMTQDKPTVAPLTLGTDRHPSSPSLQGAGDSIDMSTVAKCERPVLAMSPAGSASDAEHKSARSSISRPGRGLKMLNITAAINASPTIQVSSASTPQNQKLSLASPGGSRVPSLVLPLSTKKGKANFFKETNLSFKDINASEGTASRRSRVSLSAVMSSTDVKPTGEVSRLHSSRGSLALLVPSADGAVGNGTLVKPLPSVRHSARTPLIAGRANSLNMDLVTGISGASSPSAADRGSGDDADRDAQLTVRNKAILRPDDGKKTAASALLPVGEVVVNNTIVTDVHDLSVPENGWTDIDKLAVMNVKHGEKWRTLANAPVGVSYLTARADSLLYRDIQLHAIVVVMLISSLMRPDGAGFRPELVDRLPTVAVTAAQLAQAALEVSEALDRSVGDDSRDLDGFAALTSREHRVKNGSSKDLSSHSNQGSWDRFADLSSPGASKMPSPVPLARAIAAMGRSFRGPLPEAVRDVEGSQPGLRRVVTGVPVVRPASEVASMLVKRIHRLSSKRRVSDLGDMGIDAVVATVRGSATVRSGFGGDDMEGWAELDRHPLYVLQCHLNHPGNLALVNIQLRQQCEQRGRPYTRFLQLVCSEFFQPAHYDLRHHIASGAYGSVVAAVAAPDSPAAQMLNMYRKATSMARKSVLFTALRKRSSLPPVSPDESPAAVGGGMKTSRTEAGTSAVSSRSGASSGRPDPQSLILPITALAVNPFGDDVVPGEYVVAVKIVTFPDDPTERAILADILPEVAIMDEVTQIYAGKDRARPDQGPTGVALTERPLLYSSDNEQANNAQDALAFGCPAVCLLDYGVTASAIWMVMERCAKSLRAWRLDFPPDSPRSDTFHLKLQLELFACAVHRLAQLHDIGITHYDIKCDNILLRPGYEPAVERYLAASSSKSSKTEADRKWLMLLPYVCWADFGESVYHPGLKASETPMSSGRGTECIKAPEQLLAARNFGVAQPLRNSGEKCDVWSLGCLLYELVTGCFLFTTDDWPQFYVTVVGRGGSEPPSTVIPPLRQALLEECAGKPAAQLLAPLFDATLVRNVEARASLHDLQALVQETLAAIETLRK